MSIRDYLDRLGAALLLVGLSPLIAAVALRVKLRDGSPVLVRLLRVGEGGRTFGMIKFRTMRIEGTDGAADGPRITFGDDERITDGGRRLRARRFDELPQLLNVLRGEMALIGPRPETPAFVTLADRAWQQVLAVRPGIVGLTQLLIADVEPLVVTGDDGLERYRSELLPLKLALDALYAEAATPMLDCRIGWGLLRRIAGGHAPVGLRRYVERKRPGLLVGLDELVDSVSAQA